MSSQVCKVCAQKTKLFLVGDKKLLVPAVHTMHTKRFFELLLVVSGG